MARPYRIEGEGCFYHILSRGDDRKKIYISEQDYKKFLEYVLKAREKYRFYLYAYVLMANHYHLLIETSQANLSRIMQYINSSYTTYYNIKRKRIGHLFQGRYKSILVDKDTYFLELSRYIHLNPVRAKIVEKPEEYAWSSYKGYLNKKGDGYIDKDEVIRHFDMGTEGYRKFVLEGIGRQGNPLKGAYAGFILGTATFIKDKLKDLKEVVESKDFAYKRRLKGDIAEEKIIDLVAERYDISKEDLYKAKYRPMKAKKVVVYLLKRLTGLTNVEIGKIFGISASAVSKVAGDVERKMESDKDFKKEVEGLISRFSA